MPAIEERILIQAPQEALFDLSQDYELRLAWDPFLRAMRFLDGAVQTGVGVRVWVRARNGLTMTVEYITFHRPHAAAMKMIRGPWFFRRFAGSWRFKTQPDGMVEAVFRYAFDTRWLWLRPLLDPIIGHTLRRDIRKRLGGLKHGVEERNLLQRLER